MDKLSKIVDLALIKMENINTSYFGTTKNGDVITKFTLTNKNGMKAEIINLGGIITSLTAPDRNFNYQDVVLGFTNPENYIHDNSYFYGAIIGRFANRIAGGKFSIDGKTFELIKNEEKNQIHGGNEGFHTKIWKAEILQNPQSLKLSYISKDGEEGFPGNLTIHVTYTLTDNDELEIFCEAETDQPTVINISYHSYFNLSGDFSRQITDHNLTINARQFLPIDSCAIPLQDFMDVENTPFDFQYSKLIGKDIEDSHEQLKTAKGYDHCFILEGEGFRSGAVLSHSETGRQLEILTDQPGIQLYTGNHLDGNFETKTSGNNTERTGICLETQHFPDSPNRSDFPSVELRPGEKYETKTIYKFSVI